MQKFHLKKELDINKQSIKKSFEDNYSWLSKEELVERELDRAKILLDTRTQFYSKEEVELLLLSVWWTGSDECVADWGGDCNLDVYRTNQKREAINYALSCVGSEEELY